MEWSGGALEWDARFRMGILLETKKGEKPPMLLPSNTNQTVPLSKEFS